MIFINYHEKERRRTNPFEPFSNLFNHHIEPKKSQKRFHANLYICITYFDWEALKHPFLIFDKDNVKGSFFYSYLG